MLHPHRLTASESDTLWTPETQWDARAEAAARRAEMAHFVSGEMLLGAHPDYLAILDADDPRILATDWPPLMPQILRALRALVTRALTACLRRLPMGHLMAGAESDDRKGGRGAADPVRGLHA